MTSAYSVHTVTSEDAHRLATRAEEHQRQQDNVASNVIHTNLVYNRKARSRGASRCDRVMAMVEAIRNAVDTSTWSRS